MRAKFLGHGPPAAKIRIFWNRYIPFSEIPAPSRNRYTKQEICYYLLGSKRLKKPVRSTVNAVISWVGFCALEQGRRGCSGWGI